MIEKAPQRLVFLDQNHWVALLRSAPGSDDSATLRSLRRGVEEGRIVVPLTAGHYLETWHRARWQSRHALAELMRDLSQLRTLAPPQRVAVQELERALVGAPPPEASEILGRGVNHAFDSESGRLRLVERAWTREVPIEGAPLECPAELLAVQEAHPAVWEWMNLAGPEEDFPLEQFDDSQMELRPEHRKGDEFVSDERELVAWLQENNAMNQLREALVVEDLVSLTDDIDDCCRRLRIKPERLLEPGALAQIHKSLPSRDVIADLRALRLENRQHPLEQHDRIDLLGLGVVLVYCDVVVTERRWNHFASRARMSERFGTTVISRLNELRNEID